MIDIQAGDGISVSSGGGFTMLSLEEQARDVVERREEAVAAQQRRIYGFLPWVVGASVHFVPGEIRFNTAEYQFTDEDAGEFFTHSYALQTPEYSISSLPNSSEGVIYIEIPMEDSDVANKAVSDSETVVFGDNGSQYSVELTIRNYNQQAISGLFTIADDNNIKFTTGELTAAHNFFRKILCDFSTDSAGTITVTPRHIGTIHVPQVVQYVTTINVGES